MFSNSLKVQQSNIDYNKSVTITNVLNRIDKLFLLPLPTSNSIYLYSNLVREIILLLSIFFEVDYSITQSEFVISNPIIITNNKIIDLT